MLESIKNTSLFKSLNLSKKTHHAYLFTSLDKELNNSVALAFAKMLLCETSSCCNLCFGCKQFNSLSHPDFYLINQPSIKVDDINKIIDKLNTKPISNSKKVFVILNAENINDIAQNKILKTLEEPNPSNIFVLSTCKTDKLLTTVLSRLNKINIPKLSKDDKLIIADELLNQNIDIKKYLNSNITLTDMINFESNENYIKTINAIKYIFQNLKSSQDIPVLCNSLPDFDKTIFFSLLEKVFMDCLNNNVFYDIELQNIISSTYEKKVLIKCLPLIEDAFKKQSANVNFTYILDNLLFNILKEKFLCKQ